MTEACFYEWVLCFVHWLSIYRAVSLPMNLKQASVLLILDGHSSRACPEALRLLRFHNVEVLCLPGHCTHLLQPFDVLIAPVLKVNFRKFLAQEKALLGESKRRFASQAAEVRYLWVTAFLKAWYSSATPINCARSFELTGIYPPVPERVLSSPFVVQQAIEPVEHTLINNQIITEPEIIDAIALNKQKRDPFLEADYARCASDGVFPDFVNIVSWMMMQDQKCGRLLSYPPSLFFPIGGVWQLVTTFVPDTPLPIHPIVLQETIQLLAQREEARAEEVVHEVLIQDDIPLEKRQETALVEASRRMARSEATKLVAQQLTEMMTVIGALVAENITSAVNRIFEDESLPELDRSVVADHLMESIVSCLRRCATAPDPEHQVNGAE